MASAPMRHGARTCHFGNNRVQPASPRLAGAGSRHEHFRISQDVRTGFGRCSSTSYNAKGVAVLPDAGLNDPELVGALSRRRPFMSIGSKPLWMVMNFD